MNNGHTLIFQHLHRTGGTTLFTIMKRYFDSGATYRIDEFRSAKKYSVEYFLNLSQNERDGIKLLRGHLPFGMHNYFSHPCDYITILRDPVERVLSEYSQLAVWSQEELKIFKDYEKIRRTSFKDFISSDVAAVNNYQTSVLSGNWIGRYDKAAPLGEGALEKAKNNLKNYFKAVGTTDRLDEAILVFAKLFGWRNPYYLERKQMAKRDGVIPPANLETCEEIIINKNKLDAELYRFAGDMLDKSIIDYGSNFKRDFKRFKYVNGFLGVLYGAGRSIPSFLKRPVKNILRTKVFSNEYENMLP